MTDAVCLDDAWCRYDTADVLQNVSLSLPAGSFAALIGPSGGGKTTLLKVLLGLQPLHRGHASIYGEPVVPGRPPAGVGYVPQLDTIDWDFPVTVEEVVSMGFARQGWGPWLSSKQRTVVADTLARLGLDTMARRHLRELSGGQQQRMFLARALLSRPRLLLLDEPTSGADVRTRRDILTMFSDLQRDGITVLLTSHELSAVAAHVPWTVCLHRRLIAAGPSETVLTDAVLSDTFGVPLKVHWQDGTLLVGEAGL